MHNDEDYGNEAGESLKSDCGIAYCSSNDIADLGTWRTLTNQDAALLLRMIRVIDAGQR